MRITVVSRDKRRLLRKLPTILKFKKHLSYSPDVVVAVGGDGTFIASERIYPGIPKLAVRDQSICNKCDWDNLEEGIKRILHGRFVVKELPKLMARFNRHELEAMNDIVIRNILPTHALRFKLWIGRKQIGKEWIGDGLVVSTAFGSEGYFRSITRTHFEDGLGIAFNNTTKPHDPIILAPDAKIIIRLMRGTANIAVDNNPEIYVIPEGSRIMIRKSNRKARIIRLR